MENQINDILDIFDDSKQKEKFKKFIFEISEKLRKAKIPNFFKLQEIFDDVLSQSYDELTSIDRSTGDAVDGVEFKSNLERVSIYLKEIRKDFLKAPVFISESRKEYVHPMDIVNRVLEKSDPEAGRILTENLDKMKFALPFVFPSYTSRPTMRLWPLVGVNRQTRDKKFNMFQNQNLHHVVAFVRMGHSDGITQKLTSHSKTKIANGIFFQDQPKFVSRSQPDLSKALRRCIMGTMETAIHTPNKNFEKFFQVWNLHGNTLFNGLKPQVDLISQSASVIIVILDDDKTLDFMEQKIIEKFGRGKILVVIPKPFHSDSDTESDEEETSTKMNLLKYVSYSPLRKQDSFSQIRSHIKNFLDSKPKFNFQKIITNPTWSRHFNFDFEHDIIKAATNEVEELLNIFNDLTQQHALNEVQQHCFPLYFSKSPIDESKKIVEHIEILK